MTGRRRPILLLANPAAGGQPGAPRPPDSDPEDHAPEALAARLIGRGLQVTLRVLAAEDDAAALALQAAREGCDVVVAGGDGTVGPVAAALCGEEEATLGILALGSWNNIAHGFGLPARADEALDVIADGRTAWLDAGLAWHVDAQAAPETGDRPPPDAARFFEAAGVGLDAAGFGLVQLSGRRGWRNAAGALWRGLRRRRTRMTLEIDGRRDQIAAPAVTICNGPYLGMGFALAPDADPADGMLDVVVFAGMGRGEVLRHFLAVARRRPRHEPRLRRLRARQLTITGERGALPVHADGRSIGGTPVRIAIEPAALRVFSARDRGSPGAARRGT